jgi:hypothetical protein
MPAKKGQPHTLSYPQLQETVQAYLSAGSMSGASKLLGLSRRATQHRIDIAKEAGLIDIERPETQPSRWRPADEIIARRKEEFRRVREAAPGNGLNIIPRPHDGPFMLIAFGDTHFDNPGTDLDLFEYWADHLDRDDDRVGLLLGDGLDNWVKPLAYLYAQAETPAPEGWTLFEHYIDKIAPHLDASVGGNHDAWNGGDELVSRILGSRGVLHRGTSLRVAYQTPSGRQITLNLRHSWPGRSMWNEVHGMKRAARMGVRDTILLGGHTHVSGESLEKDPINKRLTWCVQVASFKIVDDYADDLGLLDRASAPAVALVIDPRRADTDPELVKTFHDPAAAARYLNAIREAS